MGDSCFFMIEVKAFFRHIVCKMKKQQQQPDKKEE